MQVYIHYLIYFVYGIFVWFGRADGPPRVFVWIKNQWTKSWNMITQPLIENSSSTSPASIQLFVGSLSDQFDCVTCLIAAKLFWGIFLAVLSYIQCIYIYIYKHIRFNRVNLTKPGLIGECCSKRIARKIFRWNNIDCVTPREETEPQRLSLETYLIRRCTNNTCASTT